MFAKRLFASVAVAAIALFTVTICYAEGNVVLFQAYAWEQNIDFYIAGDMNTENLSCKVSNQVSEISGSGFLADGDITVRTTILLDISASMPSQTRGNVKLFIDTLIQNVSKNEEYKMVVFGEELTVLQDFTSDRYDLSIAADKMEFNGQQSMIYDAIYNTIPKVWPVDNNPCFYRTIVITDGVDDTASGVTKEELYLKLQAETYPIDIVAVSKSEQAEQEKELSALTRMSGGRYVNLHAESDVTLLMADISVDSVLWIRAVVPGALLDGSVRQVNITDGVSSLQYDIKVPVFDVPVSETEQASDVTPAEASFEEPSEAPLETALEEQNTPDVSATEQASVPEKANIAKPILDLFGDYTLVIFIGAGAGVILLIAIIAAVLIIAGKKRKSKGNLPPVSKGSVVNKKTEIIDGASSVSTGGALSVRLRNINNPDQIWNLSLSIAVLVGRDTGCQVCIDESSMARQQCKLYLMNNSPMVENLSRSNITQLNGEQVNSPSPIKEGDKLKCGRVTLMIDSLYSSDSSNAGNLNKMTGFVNV